MSQAFCSHCGGEIEGVGIRHRGHLFCGDECCDSFEAEFVSRGVPGADELADDDFEDDEEFELEDEDFEDDDDLDDDALGSDGDDDRDY